METKMTPARSYKGLIIASLIWLVAVAAALGGGVLRGLLFWELAPYAIGAAIPALMSIILAPVTHRDWARILVIFVWISLAIVACAAVGFIPMAILFLCAPAAAALFTKETVLETIVLSALLAFGVYYAGQQGWFPDSIATEAQSYWSKPAAVMTTIAMVLGSLFGVASTARTKFTGGGNTGSDDVLNFVPGSVLRLNDDNTIIYASDEASETFGMLDKDHNGLKADALFDDDPDTQAAFAKALSRARSSRFRQSVRLKTRLDDNRVTHMNVIATPLSGGEQLIHITDMSEHHDDLEGLQRARIDAQQESKDKTLFFAGVSHELRTPLNAIIGFSDMMRSRLFGPLPGKYAEYADLIHDSGQHMLDLIGDVLDLTKVDAGKYELQYGAFDAADVIRSSVKMIRPAADAASVEIVTNIANGDELILEADRKAVRQILLNLLSNAVKFSQKGGRVEVSAREDGHLLNISVSDNGMGMSPEDLERVGEPYTQAESAGMIDERGSGLGLSLVKSLCELHKGRFSIASKLGEGTVVDIYLPLERPSPR